MRILPPSIDGDRAEFSEFDMLARSQLADGLSALLTVSDDPLVVGIDGEWGTGKTTFLKLWARQLSAAGFPVIRFDAYEHDYIEDPFLALAGQVIGLSKSLSPASGHQAFLHKAKKAGVVLLRSGLKSGSKLATLGAFDALEVADKLSEVVAGSVSDGVEAYVQELLTSQSNAKNAFAEFRSALTELPGLMCQSRLPLVFVIDELDRCRPEFALRTLERIKHFFQVPNVHFVLGANFTQLSSSIAATYGVGTDGWLYLQRFIHLTYRLGGANDNVGGSNFTSKLLDYLLARMGFSSTEEAWLAEARKPIEAYANHHNVSLRSIERILSVLAVTCATGRSRTMGKPPAPIPIGSLCVLKVMEPQLFAQTVSGKLRWADLARAFGLPEILQPGDAPKDVAAELAWWLAAIANDDAAGPTISNWVQAHRRYDKSIPPRNLGTFYAAYDVDGFGGGRPVSAPHPGGKADGPDA